MQDSYLMPFPAEITKNTRQNIWKNGSRDTGYHTVKDSVPSDMKNKKVSPMIISPYCLRASRAQDKEPRCSPADWVEGRKLRLRRPRQTEFSGQRTRKSLEIFTGSPANIQKSADQWMHVRKLLETGDSTWCSYMAVKSMWDIWVELSEVGNS